MIAITVFTDETKNHCDFLTDDIKIENISSEDYFDKQDWEIMEDCVANLDTNNYKPNEWYQLTFKRVYEYDGSGARNVLWFELVESLIVTQK